MADPIQAAPSGPSETVPPAEASPTNTRQRHPFSRQEEFFIFCNLMLFTCLFLPWHIQADHEITPWDRFVASDSPTYSAAWIVLFAVYAVSLWSTFRPRVRPWLAILTVIVVNGAIQGSGIGTEREAWGAELTRLLALGLLILSANPAIASARDLTMRALNSRKAEVFTHWGTVVPGIQFSAQEFYAKVEQAIRERQWPGVDFLRVFHSEAGILSHKREYLRVIRQRQVFDLCAAKFGNDYFFTLREAEIKAQLTVATLIILFTAIPLLLHLFLTTFGFLSGLVAFGVFLVFVILLLMNVLRMGLTRLDGLLMRTPVIGPVYETWFRQSTTYFQHDTRVVFLKLMDELVKAHVDEETSAKGVQLLSCFEHQPIFDGFYKTSTRTPKGGVAK